MNWSLLGHPKGFSGLQLETPFLRISLERPMTISGKLALRRIFSRNSLGLMALCLCVIMGSVLLMNFERPRAAVRNDSLISKDTPADAPTGEKSPAQTKGALSTGASVTTPLSARSVITDLDQARTLQGLLIPVYGVAANQ